MLQHVIYMTADGHVHEVQAPIGSGTWTHNDLTQVAGAPPAGVRQNDLTSFTSWADPNIQHVGYQADDGSVFELFSPIGSGVWTYMDLTGLTSVFALQASPFTSWSDPNSQHIVYADSNRHVHELYSGIDGGTWAQTDLSTVATAPPYLASSITSWVDTNDQHVVYLGDGDGHVHELVSPIGGGAWAHNDLNALTGAPQQDGGTFTSWVDSNYQHVIYMSGGEVLELYSPIGGGAWKQNDLTAATAAPPTVFGPLTSWAESNWQYVVYVAADGHMHGLYSPIGGGGWAHNDLTAATDAPPALVVTDPESLYTAAETPLTSWTDPDFQHVVYETADGHMHELRSPAGGGGRWTHNDLTIAASAPSAILPSYWPWPGNLISFAPPGNLLVGVEPVPAPGVRQNYLFGIVDAADNSPVQGALVTINNGPAGGAEEQTSDANGRAEFSGVTLTDIIKLD